jgi:hypothetical protein
VGPDHRGLRPPQPRKLRGGEAYKQVTTTGMERTATSLNGPGILVAPALLFALIHRSAWKRYSRKFAVAISGISSPIKPPSCRVERDHPRSPPHVATNGARKRSKLLRLATGRLPENFGVLRTSPSRSSPKFAPDSQEVWKKFKRDFLPLRIHRKFTGRWY